MEVSADWVGLDLWVDSASLIGAEDSDNDEVGVSDRLRERPNESATLVDRLNESWIADILLNDSLIEELLGRLSASVEVDIPESSRQWCGVEDAFEFVDEGGRFRESKDVLHECEGLTLLGEAGEALLPELMEEVARDVVDPSLARERRAGED